MIRRLHAMASGGAALLFILSLPGRVLADEASSAGVSPWAIHGQWTTVVQKHSAFRAPYSGDNSLAPSERQQETTDLTLMLGVRPWRNAEIWINPEIDQGFGLSNTLGVAGFPSGEAYKVGQNAPYLRLPRAFLRQVVPLGGQEEEVEGVANQMAGSRTANNIIITVGKFSVTDIFDANTYAHDPRGDFLNWSVIDAGAFDYAADAWGFTYGGAVEWNQDVWSGRAGLFQLSGVPNGKVTGFDFSQHMVVAEAERRHQWQGRPGKIKLLVFANRGKMGRYDEAVAQSLRDGTVPDTAAVRRRQSRAGWSLNVEQDMGGGIGSFLRLSGNDGSKEAYEFTEINRSASAGLAVKGSRWGREGDTLGAAVAVNGLSPDARQYFGQGGLGILIGDGRLSYAPEKIGEIYYAARVGKALAISFDAQRIVNPAYNHDRGPVTVYALRLHADF
ncbi:carbohydrate porin [Noviherbaspirillum galbum]|uniref:Carbohydrate porin n=1 Tax=Noviherbaspirillum galbum TaxID=2709383 RepID=A0A6B3SYN4_9BURK|nr:carbohydrate porin [Noviherbaspirillum galbum]NEX64606.1 carbohydrate porin [Noviherbaspirillum galbum]